LTTKFDSVADVFDNEKEEDDEGYEIREGSDDDGDEELVIGGSSSRGSAKA